MAVSGGGGDLRELASVYTHALIEFVSRPEEAGLHRAYELGRAGLNHGSGVLEVALLHSRALADATTGAADSERLRLLNASERFLIEVLSPFEMAHRAFREAKLALQRLNGALESHSRRIAGALHDDALQLLVPLHLAIADLGGRVHPDVLPELERLRALLFALESRLRDLSHEVRPPALDGAGLVPALRELAGNAGRRWGFAVDVEADSALDDRMSPAIEAAVYRVASEALTNVGRHAHATRARLSVRRMGSGIACRIADDGVGFGENGAPKKGFGLISIGERVAALGGVLHVQPNRPRGVELTIELPIGGPAWRH
ncbi:MAG: hypothetical protein IT176_03375 [Acidobacteria bacterium]|nr:hypothetical protein [Acidobacteriota bacterium]